MRQTKAADPEDDLTPRNRSLVRQTKAADPEEDLTPRNRTRVRQPRASHVGPGAAQ